jgi:hypothetical protein
MFDVMILVMPMVENDTLDSPLTITEKAVTMVAAIIRHINLSKTFNGEI